MGLSCRTHIVSDNNTRLQVLSQLDYAMKLQACALQNSPYQSSQQMFQSKSLLNSCHPNS